MLVCCIVMLWNWMIVVGVLFLDIVNFFMCKRVWNVKVKVVVNSLVLYMVLYIVCNVGIILFKSCNVIGKWVFLCSVVFCMFWSSFFIIKWLVGFIL